MTVFKLAPERHSYITCALPTGHLKKSDALPGGSLSHDEKGRRGVGLHRPAGFFQGRKGGFFEVPYMNSSLKWCGAVFLPSLVALSATQSAQAQSNGICSRTKQVRDAIVAQVSGKTTCGAITETDLAAISILSVADHNSLTELKGDDFDNLTNLTWLDLASNKLSSLPEGVFDNLTSLVYLYLDYNNLTSLPEGVFDKLTDLRVLYLDSNDLGSLPSIVFDNLTNLRWLYLDDNKLKILPEGVFDNLTKLISLDLLNNNSLTCLPSIPSSVTTLNTDEAKSSYAACGARLTVDNSSLEVVTDQTSTYTVVLDAAPNGSAGDVTVTPSSSDATKATVSDALTFTESNWSTPQTITVTGVATGSVSISHSVSGGGYGAVATPSVAVDVVLTLSGTAARSDSSVLQGEVVARQVATPSAPPKPTVNAGDQQVTLSWRAPDDDGGAAITSWDYATKQGDNAYGEWKEIPNSAASTTSYTVTGLSNGKTYRFKIRAVNSVGNGKESPESDAVMPSISKETIEEAMVSEALEQVMAHNVAAVTSRLGTISSGDLPNATISLDTVVEDGADFLWNHRKALHRGTMDWEGAISGSSFLSPLHRAVGPSCC